MPEIRARRPGGSARCQSGNDDSIGCKRADAITWRVRGGVRGPRVDDGVRHGRGRGPRPRADAGLPPASSRIRAAAAVLATDPYGPVILEAAATTVRPDD